MERSRVTWFGATSGGFLGLLGLVACAVWLVLVVVDGITGPDVSIALGLLLVGVLCWTALLRPRVGLTDDALVLRSMLSEARLPLAAVESFAVRSFSAAQVGGRRYVSAGVGRTTRQMRPAGEGLVRPFSRLTSYADEHAGPDPQSKVPDHVEAEVLDRMRAAREDAGVRARSAEQTALAAGVRRTLAWPEIVALAVLGLGLAGSFLL